MTATVRVRRYILDDDHCELERMEGLPWRCVRCGRTYGPEGDWPLCPIRGFGYPPEAVAARLQSLIEAAMAPVAPPAACLDLGRNRES